MTNSITAQMMTKSKSLMLGFFAFFALSIFLSGCDTGLVDFEGQNYAWVAYENEKGPARNASDLSQAEFALDDFCDVRTPTRWKPTRVHGKFTPSPFS